MSNLSYSLVSLSFWRFSFLNLLFLLNRLKNIFHLSACISHRPWKHIVLEEQRKVRPTSFTLDPNPHVLVMNLFSSRASLSCIIVNDYNYRHKVVPYFTLPSAVRDLGKKLLSSSRLSSSLSGNCKNDSIVS